MSSCSPATGIAASYGNLDPCHICFGRLEAHHIKKASAGGSWTPDNLLTLCSQANNWVEMEPNRAHALGLVIRAGETPEDAAARRAVARGDV